MAATALGGDKIVAGDPAVAGLDRDAALLAGTGDVVLARRDIGAKVRATARGVHESV